MPTDDRGAILETALLTIRLLRSARWTVPDLSRAIGVGRRTTYRIFEALEAQGIDIKRLTFRRTVVHWIERQELERWFSPMEPNRLFPRCLGPGPNGTRCGRPLELHGALGLCSSHYNQQNRGSPLRPIGEPKRKKPKKCRGPECDRIATRRGLCAAHDLQRARQGELKPIRSYRKRTT